MKPKSETTMNKLTAVDLNDLYDLSRGNNEFIKEMIEIFITQNPIDLKELETAISKKDFAAMRSTSHRMKTSLGFMGMKPLLKPLDQIEVLASDKADLKQIEFHYKEIKNSCDKAMKELDKLLLKLKKSIG